MGLLTVLWCYLRNPPSEEQRRTTTCPPTSRQANHLGMTIEADIIKQKQPKNNGGYNALRFGKTTRWSTAS